MTEDPARQLRRTALEKEKVKIATAQQWLAAAHKDNDEDVRMREGFASGTEVDTKEDLDGLV